MSGSHPPLPIEPERFGDYWLYAELGKGASGRVYLATRAGDASRKLLAVKRLHEAVAPSGVRRLKHEAAIAVVVDSPHVVRVLDVGVVGAEHFLAMEYVSGWSVAQLLNEASAAAHRFAVPQLVALARGALTGLDALHRAAHPETGEPLGIVHRDISPRNVSVTPDARMVLLDLGLGKSGLRDWRTATGLFCGSPGYAAPEQVLAKRVDHRADLYSLAVLLFELLTLEVYVPRGDRQQILRQSCQPNFRPPSALRPDVPPRLDQVLERALAIAPELRFDRALDFADALLEAVPEAAQAAGSFDPGPALQRQRGELEARLFAAISPSDPADPPDHQETVLYAHRAAEISEPATIFSRPPWEAATVADRPTRVEPTPAASPAPAPRRPSPAPRPIGAAVLGVLSLAVLSAALTFAFSSSSPEPPSADPLVLTPIERAPAPKVEPGEIAPSIEPDPLEPQNTASATRSPSAEPPRSAIHRRKNPAARGSGAKQPAELERAEVSSPQEAMGALAREVSTFKSSRPDLAPELDRIIADASLWMRAKDPERVRAAHRALRRRFDEIAAARRSPSSPADRASP